MQQIINIKLPRVAPTRWIYNSRIVNTVYECYLQLTEFFGSVIENPDIWENETISAANGISNFLNGFQNIFLLETFNAIFRYTDVLYNILQKKCFEIQLEQISETKAAISGLRDKFNDIFEKTVQIVGPPKPKRNLNTEPELRLHLKKKLLRNHRYNFNTIINKI